MSDKEIRETEDTDGQVFRHLETDEDVEGQKNTKPKLGEDDTEGMQARKPK